VYPVLWDPGIEIGGIPIRFYSYGLCMAVGFVSAMVLFVLRASRHHDPFELFLFTLFTFAGGFVGSKLMFILVNLEYYRELPSVQLGGCTFPPVRDYLMSGMVWYGGVLGALPVAAAYVAIRRLRFLHLADAAAPALSLGHAWGRLGCFFAGCCYGEPSSLPWAMTFPRSSVAWAELVEEGSLARTAERTMPLHPTQLYESAAELVIFLGLVVFSRHQRRRGQTAALYLTCYGAFRFAIEFLRGDLTRGGLAGLSTSQWISMGLFVLGAALFTWGWVRWHRGPAPRDRTPSRPPARSG
jgi:phosphatidylglycerol:prolipoprotein diacylglycerol transferase